MNLIKQIARLMDDEGAYGQAFDGTGENASLIPFSARQKYFQAKYEHEATEIAKLILGAGIDKLRADLVEFEVDCWERLGAKHPDLREMVENLHTR